MTRREVIGLLGASGSLLANSAPRFRLAVCNETFEGAAFAESCRLARSTGYTGLEVMPSTLSPDPASLSAGRRTELRRIMNDAGVEFTGLHSIMSAPAGLHLTTPDDAVRRRGWEYFRQMIDLCGDLGTNRYLVLGSAKQRAAAKGESVEDALKRLRDGLAESAPHAAERRVLLLAEPLAPHLCNVLNTLAQAVEMVRSINHPAVQTMFDTHNTAGETEPHDELIRKYARYIRHVHVNEMDGRHPGTGKYDFGLMLRALRQIGYSGWISLEVFQFKPSGEEVARAAAAFLRRLEVTTGSSTREVGKT
jgi:sugar phosphate isomerase/epimerase